MGPALDTAERGERLLQNTLGQANHYWHTRLQKFHQDGASIFYLIEESPHSPTPTSGSQLPTSGSHWKSGWNWQLLWDTYPQGKATSLQYHWRVGRTTICKFVPRSTKPYLVCPTDPEDWKKIEERLRNRWNVPHAVGTLDGKHIAIKKPKKSGSEYFNYKGYFSLVLLALVNAVPVGQHGGQWVIIWCTNFSTAEELRTEGWDYHHLNHLDLGSQIYTTCCWGTMPLPWCLGS